MSTTSVDLEEKRGWESVRFKLEARSLSFIQFWIDINYWNKLTLTIGTNYEKLETLGTKVGEKNLEGPSGKTLKLKEAKHNLL